jgi:hypothetical protein
MAEIPQIEGPVEMGIYGIGPMALKYRNMDMNRMPLVTIVNGLDGLATLDETLGFDMV